MFVLEENVDEKKMAKQVSMKWLQIYEEELVKGPGETDVRKKKNKTPRSTSRDLFSTR